MVAKGIVVFMLYVLAYTKYGMFFPKGSDTYLHLVGGFLLSWIIGNPYLYFLAAILAEIAQPVLCPRRGFDMHDLFMNLAGATIYFIMTNFQSIVPIFQKN